LRIMKYIMPSVLSQRGNPQPESGEPKKRKTLALSREPKKRKTLALSREPKTNGTARCCPVLFWNGGQVSKANTLKLYKMRDGFVEFMHNVDSRVQFNKTERRPYVGVVLTIGEHDYFVPMESPKPNHRNMKSNIHIMKIEDGRYGILGFNNMIPAKKHYLIEFDIDKEPDEKYKRLLYNQLLFCNNHKQEIFARAKKTYDAVAVKRQPFFMKICCDFKKLEAEYTKYYYKTITY